MPRTSIKWHVGCSGFHYAEWKGSFYPEDLPKSKWFNFYGSAFDTLELNSSFYRFPTVSSLHRWYKLSPRNFSFSVKAPRSITHFRQFKECAKPLGDFYRLVGEGLQEKLATVLFQLPPVFEYSMERLERILVSLNSTFVNVVEFRHSSWWQPVVFAALAKKKVVFAGQSHPSLPDEPVVNGEVGYYRFHGVPRLYYSSYSEDKLADIADRMRSQRKLKEAYVYFNNTAEISAINNARWFRSHVDGNRTKRSSRSKT